jgi:hypothetical protein
MAAPTQGDLLMAAKARKQAQRASVQWDEDQLRHQASEATSANRQRIDEPKTRRWIDSTADARLAEGVTLQPQLQEMLRALFAAIDDDGNGEISKNEALKFWDGNFSQLNASSMFEQIDADGNGSISWEEYITFWKTVVGRGYPEDDLIREVEAILEGRSWVSFNKGHFQYKVDSSSTPASTAVLSRAAFPGYSEAMRRFNAMHSARSPPASSARRNPFESRLAAMMDQHRSR